jgi:hypothetical protein
MAGIAHGSGNLCPMPDFMELRVEDQLARSEGEALILEAEFDNPAEIHVICRFDEARQLLPYRTPEAE